jgi:hypothetical protein
MESSESKIRIGAATVRERPTVFSCAFLIVVFLYLLPSQSHPAKISTVFQRERYFMDKEFERSRHWRAWTGRVQQF